VCEVATVIAPSSGWERENEHHMQRELAEAAAGFEPFCFGWCSADEDGEITRLAAC